jgi:hypothetical protein
MFVAGHQASRWLLARVRTGPLQSHRRHRRHDNHHRAWPGLASATSNSAVVSTTAAAVSAHSGGTATWALGCRAGAMGLMEHNEELRTFLVGVQRDAVMRLAHAFTAGSCQPVPTGETAGHLPGFIPG